MHILNRYRSLDYVITDYWFIQLNLRTILAGNTPVKEQDIRDKIDNIVEGRKVITESTYVNVDNSLQAHLYKDYLIVANDSTFSIYLHMPHLPIAMANNNIYTSNDDYPFKSFYSGLGSVNDALDILKTGLHDAQYSFRITPRGVHMLNQRNEFYESKVKGYVRPTINDIEASKTNEDYVFCNNRQYFFDKDSFICRASRLLDEYICLDNATPETFNDAIIKHLKEL